MLTPAPDHAHSHAHGTGVRWLDMIVALSAIFISLLSLYASIEHGRTMKEMVAQNERLVAGSTMPLLSVFDTQLDPVTHQRILHLVLKNGGVGPAVIEWFEIRFNNQPYGDLKSLLHACCSSAIQPQDRSSVVYSNVSGTVLPQRESTNLIELPASISPQLLNAFTAAREHMSFNACFCSVLNECWMTDFNTAHPQPVKTCPGRTRERVW